MNKTVNCLIDIMAASLGARPLNTDFDGVNFRGLLDLAILHRIDIPMYYALRNVEGVPEEMLAELKKRQDVNSLKSAVVSAETEYLNGVFDKNEIPYMLLKGSVIRELYPHPDMRTSCDVDYLTKLEDAQKIEKLMLASGYYFETHQEGVDNYKKAPFSSIEIHRELMSGHKNFDCLHHLWENAVDLENTTFGKKMSHDDFYIYTIVHIAKHVTYGGSGIRPLMDMYLYLKNYRDILDWDYIYSTLSTVGLDTLGKELDALQNHWFCGGEKTDVTDSLSEYVISSGIFGTVKNSEAQREVYRRSGTEISKRPSFLKTAFLSYKNMTLRYPSLKTPILLPVYWVIRIVDVLLHKREKIAPLMGPTTKVEEAEIQKTEKLFTRLGIINKSEEK